MKLDACNFNNSIKLQILFYNESSLINSSETPINSEEFTSYVLNKVIPEDTTEVQLRVRDTREHSLTISYIDNISMHIQ